MKRIACLAVVLVSVISLTANATSLNCIPRNGNWNYAVWNLNFDANSATFDDQVALPRQADNLYAADVPWRENEKLCGHNVTEHRSLEITQVSSNQWNLISRASHPNTCNGSHFNDARVFICESSARRTAGKTWAAREAAKGKKLRLCTYCEAGQKVTRRLDSLSCAFEQTQHPCFIVRVPFCKFPGYPPGCLGGNE